METNYWPIGTEHEDEFFANQLINNKTKNKSQNTNL